MPKRIINIVFWVLPILLCMWVYSFFSTNPLERNQYLNGGDPLQALNFAKSLFSGQYGFFEMYHHGALNRHLYFFSMGIYILFYLICGKHLLLAYFLNICFYIVIFYVILYFGIKYILLFNYKAERNFNIKLKAKKYTMICSCVLYLFFSVSNIVLPKMNFPTDVINNYFYLTFHTPAAIVSMLSLVIVFRYFAMYRGNNKKLKKYFCILLVLLLAGTLFEDFFVLIFAVVPIFVACSVLFSKEKLKTIFNKKTYFILFFIYLFYIVFVVFTFLYFSDRPLELFQQKNDAPLHNFVLIILTFGIPLCMLIFFLICFSKIKIVLKIKKYFRSKNILFSFSFLFIFVSLLFSFLYFFTSLHGRKCDSMCLSITARGLHPTLFVLLFLIAFLILKIKVQLPNIRKTLSFLFVFIFAVWTITPFINKTNMPPIVFNVKNNHLFCYEKYHKDVLKGTNTSSISNPFTGAGIKLYVNPNIFAVNFLPNVTSGLGHIYSIDFPKEHTKIYDFLLSNSETDSNLTPKYSNTLHNGNKFLVVKCPGYTIYHSEKSFDRYTSYKIYDHFLPADQRHVDFNAK